MNRILAALALACVSLPAMAAGETSEAAAWGAIGGVLGFLGLGLGLLIVGLAVIVIGGIILSMWSH